MKVLQVCHKPPYPKKDGGCIAIAAITEGFANRNNDLRILTATTHKHGWVPSVWPGDLKGVCDYVELNTELNRIDAIKNVFGSGSYNVDRFYSEDFAGRVKQILAEFQPEIVWLESLFMVPYIKLIRAESNAKVILRAHNVEHMIWERMAENSRSFAKKKYLHFLAKRLKKFELKAITEVDAIAAITEDDASFFSNHSSATVQLVPIGIDPSEFERSDPTQPLTLFHLGDMNWEPNSEAVQFLVNEVWPRVIANCPEAVCHLAGRNMPQELISRSGSGLSIQGEIADAKAFFNEHTIMILPLLSGGGMRVKMLEAMAMGKIILTTSVGAEGIGGVDGEHYLIADSPEAFAKTIAQLYDSKFDLEQISKAARTHVEEHFSNDVISKDVDYFCRHLAGVEQQ